MGHVPTCPEKQGCVKYVVEPIKANGGISVGNAPATAFNYLLIGTFASRDERRLKFVGTKGRDFNHL